MTQTGQPDPPLGEILSSERGFDGAWVQVRVDRVRLPSGRIATRETVEHPGSVAIVGVTCDGHVLLLRQSHHPIQQTLLGLPAGTLEPGEAPEDCARRELLEETGYCAGPLSLLARYFTSPGYTSEMMTVYLAEECAPAGGEIDPDELITVQLFPLADIASLVTPGPNQVADSKTLVGLLMLLRHRES